MKSSKVYLAVTTAVLVFTGIVTVKAHRSPKYTVYYTDKTAQHCCFTVSFQTKCTINAPGPRCVFRNQQGLNYPLYTTIIGTGGCNNCANEAKCNIQ